MTKTFTPKPGDKWKRFTDGSGMVRYADNSEVRLIGRWGIDAAVSASSVHGDPIDLPTPDALAQLREWGYEVSGEQPAGDKQPSRPTILPFGWYSETLCAPNWEGPVFYPYITEARVREIVSEMLAAHPTPAEVREAIAIANDPNTKWHDVTEPEVDHDDWRAKCKVWQPTPNSNIGEPWAAHSPSGKWSLSASSTGHILGWDLVGGVFLGRNFKTEADARAALAKAPPPPDVDDFNGLKEAGAPEPVRWSDIYNTPHSLRVAIEGPIMAKSPAWTGERVVIMDAPANIAAPEPDWKGLLEAVVNAPTHTQHDNAMTAAASALTAARTNGGGK